MDGILFEFANMAFFLAVFVGIPLLLICVGGTALGFAALGLGWAVGTPLFKLMTACGYRPAASRPLREKRPIRREYLRGFCAAALGLCCVLQLFI